MIRIIAEGVYDTAHSVFEAHEIRKEHPDAVLMELPDYPFQGILDDYMKGKLNLSQLKKELGAAIELETLQVDHDLVNKFLEGEIEEEELEVIATEGREIHVMRAAKEVGAELHAMDMPIEEVEKLIEHEFEEEHIENTKQVIKTKNLPFLIWKISDFFHYPYYLLERIMHHHAIKTTNPFLHNVSECEVCRIGVHWDRIVNHVVIPIFNRMPLSKALKDQMKIAYIIRRIDFFREQHMANKISEVYNRLQKKLGREPRLVAIVHLWNAVELERLIRGIE
jgi:hypothetical protein